MSRKTKTTATKEEARPALVPKLRFPEFREAEGWEYEPLGKLLMKSPDYGVNAAAVPFNELLPKYLRITDISDEGTYLSGKKVSVDLEPTDEIYLDEGDIVLARTGASVGKSYRYRKEDGRLVFAGFLIRVKPNPKRLVSTYLSNFLTTEQYWKWVVATSARSGQPGINSVEYSSLAIPLPADFAEQQKIAECLGSVDELIAAQARKLDALKTHKKGLMQQLFPREGETQPRLRSPEFQNKGEWVEEKLKDLLAAVIDNRGKTPPLSPDGYPLVEVNALGSCAINFARVSKYVDAETYNSWFRGHVQSGDVLFSTVGAIAESSVVCDQYQPVIAQNIVGIRFKKTMSHLFGFYLLNAIQNKAKFLRITMGAVQPSLKVSQMVHLSFQVSTSLAEQQRIATCLSSLDALITSETQKQEALKTHKKGLMQQLFPSPEEVEV